MYFISSLVAILHILPFAFSVASPLVIPWNTTHSYGPDGPWPVITIQVGSSNAADTQPLSTVDLYPGGIGESMILRRLFCNANGTTSSNGSSECLAEKAGLYFLAASETVVQNITDQVGLVWQWGSNMATGVQGIAVNVLDTIWIPSTDGTFFVQNSTISAVTAWQIELPDGVYYSAQVGTLSLGAPGTGIQQFTATAAGQAIPGYASAQGSQTSNSWGLHYGSASLNLEGSLVFGGYDQSRVLGDVGAFDLGAGSTMMLNLLDIQIGVEDGPSPFIESSYNGLLKLNATFNGVQPAIINPILPYLFMSPETCAAIAENLPVTLNSQAGLYIWDTTDPQYETIVRSPAYLGFIFQNVKLGNLSIKVPFRMLNLTLEAPIVTTTQQYFPCRPFHALDGSGVYFLGKAFLQAAFIGMNWQEEKFFLAQAPGPGVGPSNIRSIAPNDTMISNHPIHNFAATWARDWTAISNTNNDRNTTALPSTNRTTGSSNADNSENLPAIPSGATNAHKGGLGSGLPCRAKIGIAVGVVVGSLIVIGVVSLYRMRGRRTALLPQESVVPDKHDKSLHEKDEVARLPVTDNWIHEKDGVARLPEMGEGLPHEADNDHEINELGL